MTRPAKPFSIGFTGATLVGALGFIEDQVGNADKVAVTMAGSGRDIAHLAREGRTIHSWDPQELSRVVVQGVFAHRGPIPDPVPMDQSVGWASQHRPMHMPGTALLLVDHIAINGTDFDRAALAHAIVRSTYMGRLTSWSRDATPDSLYTQYVKVRDKLTEWTNLPGTFDHVKGSVFDDGALEDKLCDATVLVDTPKVLTGRAAGGDIYSQGWGVLNSILQQSDADLPPWTEDTFTRDMPLIWLADYKRLIFFHVTGARPDPDHVLQAMTTDGVPDPIVVQTWDHGDRSDIAWVIDRDPPPTIWGDAPVPDLTPVLASPGAGLLTLDPPIRVDGPASPQVVQALMDSVPPLIPRDTSKLVRTSSGMVDSETGEIVEPSTPILERGGIDSDDVDHSRLAALGIPVAVSVRDVAGRHGARVEAQYQVAVRTVLARMGDGDLTLAPVDQDLNHATDYVAGDDTWGVRVRAPGQPKPPYPRDVTFRSRVPSGSRTELAKIQDGKPRWYLYAWALDELTLDDWVILDMDRLRDLQAWQWGSTQLNKDGTSFLALDLDLLWQRRIIVATSRPVDQVIRPDRRPTGVR